MQLQKKRRDAAAIKAANGKVKGILGRLPAPYAKGCCLRMEYSSRHRASNALRQKNFLRAT
jgi:hypothetical protein